jgi:hypothetical protein
MPFSGGDQALSGVPAPQTALRLIRIPASPTTVEAIPPIVSQIDLSVGTPLMARETSESAESIPLLPQTSRAIPTARSADGRLLVMGLSSVPRSQRSAAADDADEDQNDSDHEKEMDEPAHGVGGNQSE